MGPQSLTSVAMPGRAVLQPPISPAGCWQLPEAPEPLKRRRIHGKTSCHFLPGRALEPPPSPALQGGGDELCEVNRDSPLQDETREAQQSMREPRQQLAEGEAGGKAARQVCRPPHLDPYPAASQNKREALVKPSREALLSTRTRTMAI